LEDIKAIQEEESKEIDQLDEYIKQFTALVTEANPYSKGNSEFSKILKENIIFTNKVNRAKDTAELKQISEKYSQFTKDNAQKLKDIVISGKERLSAEE
jgi:uncharacterized protein YegL